MSKKLNKKQMKLAKGGLSEEELIKFLMDKGLSYEDARRIVRKEKPGYHIVVFK